MIECQHMISSNELEKIWPVARQQTVLTLRLLRLQSIATSAPSFRVRHVYRSSGGGCPGRQRKRGSALNGRSPGKETKKTGIHIPYHIPWSANLAVAAAHESQQVHAAAAVVGVVAMRVAMLTERERGGGKAATRPKLRQTWPRRQ